MVYAGVCGTDAHLVQTHPQTGYIRCSAPAKIPQQGRIIGHEGVGQVLESGSHVRHVRPGAWVTFESIIVCHFCDVCRRGQFNQCRHARLLGLEKDGLFGTIVDVPSVLTHDVTDLCKTDRGRVAAACVEPAGVAYVACENTAVTGADTVVVFGAGPIGLFTAMLSKAIFGASEVHVVEPVPFRRNFARSWCDKVHDVESFFGNPPRFVDVVVEASGHLENVDRILRRVNANGRIALLARSGHPLSLHSVDHMITNEISIVGSRGHLCGAFSKILSLYSKNRIPLDEIVTQILEGPQALCDLLQDPNRLLQEHCKVLTQFPGQLC